MRGLPPSSSDEASTMTDVVSRIFISFSMTVAFQVASIPTDVLVATGNCNQFLEGPFLL